MPDEYAITEAGRLLVEARRERDAAVEEVERLRTENRAFQETTYCAFCGERFPLGDLAATAVSKHVETCPKHPMRGPEYEAERLRAELSEAQREIGTLRAFKRGVEEALNSGNGTYRP